MEEDFAWLAAGLIFLGIIVQHDARAATPLLEPPYQDRAVIIRPVLLWPEYLDATDCRSNAQEGVHAFRPFAELQIKRQINRRNDRALNRGTIVADACPGHGPRNRAILAVESARVH